MNHFVNSPHVRSLERGRSPTNGGDGRIRTADRGFADPRLSLLATSPERKTGFEPATFSLARRRATAALLPQVGCRGGDLNSYADTAPPPQDGVSAYPPPWAHEEYGGPFHQRKAASHSQSMSTFQRCQEASRRWPVAY